MQQPLFPEEDLSKHLQQEERSIHMTLKALSELEVLAKDNNLSLQELQKQAAPSLEKLKLLNGAVAREIQSLFTKGNHIEMEHYFEREKQQLIAALNDELTHHRELIKKINREKNADFPTDS